MIDEESLASRAELLMFNMNDLKAPEVFLNVIYDNVLRRFAIPHGTHHSFHYGLGV
jgi:hypothetical protein